MKNFVQAANTLAKSMKRKHFENSPLLVFKSTRNKPHRGHETDTQCKPDITAAFEGDWAEDNTTLWPCIRLAGEQASRGKSWEEQKKQAMSYLHYLLLARPDLHVAQGLLTSKNGIMFLVGIGGHGIRRFSIHWDDRDMYKLMYAFVYRLYDPGDFGDPSYLSMIPNLQDNLVTYSIRIAIDGGDTKNDSIDCSGFSPIYASNPFESRTHILSNPQSEIKIGGKVLRVIKDQLYQLGTGFDEHSILTRVHSPEKVPGVVEAVYHESIDIPPFLDVSRVKQRMGLQQVGSPITSISTLKGVLEMVFDVLEVLRYLRTERQVLHRDISKGNILYLEEEASLALDAGSVEADTTEGEEVPLCFIKYLLKESTVPQKTSVLLIDFHHAEHLNNTEDPQYQLIGTPAFISRAVQQGEAVTLSDLGAFAPAVPISPDDYTRNHPDRIKKFPLKQKPLIEDRSLDSIHRQWRHELEHDTESVFWVLLHWVLGAQPAHGPTTNIGIGAWALLMGDISNRILLLLGMAAGTSSSGLAHPVYRPLLPLLSDLAAVLVVDRYWLDESETRNQPEYVAEALQRLILKFILDNRDEEFMTKKVKPYFRQPSDHLGLLITTSHKRNCENSRKRPSPSPSQQQQSKRRRVVKEDASESDGDDDDEEDIDDDEQDDTGEGEDGEDEGEEHERL